MLKCYEPFTDVLDDFSMPFVNRRNEIATMARIYGANAIALRKPKRVKNMRAVRLLVSSQMFGSGKTAMGSEFIGQLRGMENKEIEEETGAPVDNMLKVRCLRATTL